MKDLFKSKRVLGLIASLIIIGIIAIPFAGSRIGAHAQGPITITEFPTPTSSSNPIKITTGPDGNLWFTEFDAHQIGKITTSGTINEYAALTSNSSPWGITTGPDGNLWFTEQYGTNKIGQITTSGTVTGYSIPTGNSNPSGITSGPDGNLWFAEAGSNQIGKITTSGIVTNEYAVPTSNSSPLDITTGPDGNLWFVEYNGNQIAKITPSGAITEFPIPTSSSNPARITTGPDGNLWFTEQSANKIGKITPGGTITEYTTPSSGAPVGITSGPDGNIWFTEIYGSKIGEITPSGTITEYSLPSGFGYPVGITSGPDGNIWFTEAIGSAIGRINLASPTPTPTPSPTVTSTPSPTPSPTPTPTATPTPQTVNLSYNYAGYIASDTKSAYTTIKGDWTIPAIQQCPGNTNVTTASWVGLGGPKGTDSHIQQTGTASECINGQTHYYAWVEMFGSKDGAIHDLKHYNFTYTIEPGDSMHGEVLYQGGDSYILKLSDKTKGRKWDFTSPTLHSGDLSSSSREDALWIFEDQGGNTKIPSFADFSFDSCVANGKAIDRQPTVVREAIGTFDPQYSFPVVPIRVYVTLLQNNGKGFTVQFRG